MPQLKEYTINNPNQLIQSNHVLLNISNMSCTDIDSFLAQKTLLNKEIVIVRFIDDICLYKLFMNDEKRIMFEELLFNLIEKYGNLNRFIYFSFKISNSNLDDLIHTGFYEWLEYWMLFFKFTHINFLFEINDHSGHMPIEYVVCKRIDNPRLSIFVNCDNWKSIAKTLPEDLGVFTTVAKHEYMKNNGLPYANLFIN